MCDKFNIDEAYEAYLKREEDTDIDLHEEHTQRHIELHKKLDELVADWIRHTNKLPSKSTVIELITWSHQQCVNPMEKNVD